MAIETTWKLSVETVSPVTVGEDVYTDVVTQVNWTCIAFDGPDSESISGAKTIPMPTSPETYIPLDDIFTLEDEAKRATVLGWAEIIEPGFVAAREADVIAKLSARLATPSTSSVDLL